MEFVKVMKMAGQRVLMDSTSVDKRGVQTAEKTELTLDFLKVQK